MVNKKLGIIKAFNGYHGIILSDNKEYLFFAHDIEKNQKLQLNDKVKFFEKIVEDERGKTYIAYFISKKNIL